MGRRRYHQYCPVARALDVVGERWTLLIARELLLGPRRFTDLAEGLPGIGSSVLAGRLTDLEQSGLVAKRTLPPPAASVVYELTDEGRGLAPVLAALADWGMNLLGQPHEDDQVRARWLVLGLAKTAKGTPSIPDATYELRVDNESFQVRSHDGRLQAAQGPASNPDATITLTTDTLTAIASGELEVPSPQADRLITIDGDTAGARRLLASLTQIRASTDTAEQQ
jgi:DNA-binding HxlR family transcriptional regulator/putative sterol carrier protein